MEENRKKLTTEQIQLQIVSAWVNEHSGASLQSSWDMAKFLEELEERGKIRFA